MLDAIDSLIHRFKLPKDNITKRAVAKQILALTLVHLDLYFSSFFGPLFVVSGFRCAAAAFQTDALKLSPSPASALWSIRKWSKAVLLSNVQWTLTMGSASAVVPPDTLLESPWWDWGGLLCVCIENQSWCDKSHRYTTSHIFSYATSVYIWFKTHEI